MTTTTTTTTMTTTTTTTTPTTTTPTPTPTTTTTTTTPATTPATTFLLIIPQISERLKPFKNQVWNSLKRPWNSTMWRIPGSACFWGSLVLFHSPQKKNIRCYLMLLGSFSSLYSWMLCPLFTLIVILIMSNSNMNTSTNINIKINTNINTNTNSRTWRAFVPLLLDALPLPHWLLSLGRQ